MALARDLIQRAFSRAIQEFWFWILVAQASACVFSLSSTGFSLCLFGKSAGTQAEACATKAESWKGRFAKGSMYVDANRALVLPFEGVPERIAHACFHALPLNYGCMLLKRRSVSIERSGFRCQFFVWAFLRHRCDNDGQSPQEYDGVKPSRTNDSTFASPQSDTPIDRLMNGECTKESRYQGSETRLHNSM